MEVNRPGNQLHGKAFENLIQQVHGCPVQHYNALFDLPAMYDDYGMQVQVKTLHEKRNVIDLADASRFWRNQQPIHMLVARYAQSGLDKIFYEILEYVIGVSDLKDLKGKVPAWEVERVHDEVRSYGRGEHDMARSYAQASVALLEATYGASAVLLRPKIDNRSQRRIQCSVRLSDLESYLIRIHTDSYRGLRLPFAMTFVEADE